MNTLHTHQDYPVHPSGYHVLGRRQARRRLMLGLMLIVVGSVWLGLRVTGQVGDLPSPISWLERAVAMLGHFNSGDHALSVPPAAYGMLAAFTIRVAR